MTLEVQEIIRKCLCNCPPDCEECPTLVLEDGKEPFYLCDCEWSKGDNICYCGITELHVHCFC